MWRESDRRFVYHGTNTINVMRQAIYMYQYTVNRPVIGSPQCRQRHRRLARISTIGVTEVSTVIFDSFEV
ncbi:hypothetical protein FMUAM8_00340 [Nocardia cyriacigeorgica]|uniref:Uncharacterized protein n=1 Tax=Nocardia cyriacigeorgica (strain GUH-2) TaxID=1127134 RepID=H6R5C2_NOCCG|nr:hypothetical protein FMUAM8_00340 [Nocardia cyriacigeorgica]CCF60860.1 protein of unknown function [Nocardia cyriacigeorgica GUH-2]